MFASTLTHSRKVNLLSVVELVIVRTLMFCALVYAPDMPDRVPITILVRKFAEQIIFVILFMLRTVLVAFVWLTLLPYGTLLIWRVFFFFGNLLYVSTVHTL